MKRMMLIAVMLMFAVIMFAEIPIRIIEHAEDGVGRSFAMHLRHRFINSPKYHVTTRTTDICFVLRVATMDRYKGDYGREGVSTIFSYILTLDDGEGKEIYVTDNIGYAGYIIANSMAKDVFDDIDEWIDFLKSLVGH